MYDKRLLELLKKPIQYVLNGKDMPHSSWEEYYKVIYTLSTDKAFISIAPHVFADIYAMIKKTVETQIIKCVLPQLGNSDCSIENYLYTMKYYFVLFENIARLFICVDVFSKQYSLKGDIYNNSDNIYNNCVIVWYEMMIKKSILNNINNLILKEIQNYRQKYPTNINIIKEYADSCTIITKAYNINEKNSFFYQSYVEDVCFLIQKINNYYMINNNDQNNQLITQYIKTITETMQTELSGCECFAVCVTKDVEDLFINQCIVPYVERLKLVFMHYLNNDMFNECQMWYNFIIKLSVWYDWENLFGSFVYSYMENRYNSMLSETKNVTPHICIHKLMELYNYCCKQWLTILTKSQFRKAFDIEFKKFIDKKITPKKIAEILATYADGVLRKMIKVEISEGIENIKVCLNYVSEKDIFQNFYTRLLSRRLLAETSASDEYEETLITYMKSTHGYDFVNKMIKMFLEISVSKELSDNYIKYQSEKENANTNAVTNISKVNVLTHFAWSFQNQVMFNNFNLPAIFKNDINNFDLFYKSMYEKRQIQWIFSECRVEIGSSGIYNKPYQFSTSLFQACLLLRFNTEAEISIDELHTHLGLAENITRNIIDTLVTSSLLVEKNGKLTLNNQYTNTKLKIMIPLNSVNAQKTESVNVEKDVDENRKILIQAAIVRIMKSRKSMEHTELTTETIKAVNSKFTPDPRMIKMMIELLIEKEYLCRNEQSMNKLEYVS